MELDNYLNPFYLSGTQNFLTNSKTQWVMFHKSHSKSKKNSYNNDSHNYNDSYNNDVNDNDDDMIKVRAIIKLRKVLGQHRANDSITKFAKRSVEILI